MTPAPATDAPAETGLLRVVLRAWPLLASILMMMVGSGLQGSLLGVRAEAEGFDTAVTGAVLGLFYLGFVIGSTSVPGLIRSVGHIRVFSALVSMASASVVLHGIWVFPPAWMALRLLTGICMAGLFVVSESWLTSLATPATRGTLLAVYNSVVVGGLMIGSLLLNAADTSGLVLFVVGSVLLSVAAVPVTLAPHEAPPPQDYEHRSLRSVFHSAPLGIVGSMSSGLAVGAALGFGVVYATRAGFGVSGASQFLAVLLLGGVLGQVPLGRWSDHGDRRLVMAAAGLLVLAGSAVGVYATDHRVFALVLLAGLLIGAGGFSLYGLSFAHMADYLPPAAMTSAGARLITVNGLGAASGPLLASMAIEGGGPVGLFHLLGSTTTLFVLFVIYRLTRRDPVSDVRRSHYAPVSTSATTAGVDDLASEVAGVDVAELRRSRRLERLATLAQRTRRSSSGS